MEGEFQSFLNEIYPEELQLNKENPDNFEDSVLDFKIKIENGKLIVANLLFFFPIEHSQFLFSILLYIY